MGGRRKGGARSGGGRDVRLVRCFFFFQAEDGIRDLTVTGVQTCALPICAQSAEGIITPGSTLNPGVIIPSADWAPLADLKVGPGAAPIPDDIAARLREIDRKSVV